jgi:uncharacterized membrane-anchored protein YjiN (DUF445 family)
MSEKLIHPHERRGELGPEDNSHEQHEVNADRNHERAHEIRHEAAERLPELQHDAKERAKSLHEVTVEREETESEVPRGAIDHSVKEAARRRVMRRVQKQLRPDERLLSKFTHNPVVDAASRAAEKTVARPSGLLGGSIIAFLGSSAYLWIARHYGYDYNYLLFFILFVGGFAVGMTLEVLSHTLRHRKTRS